MKKGQKLLNVKENSEVTSHILKLFSFDQEKGRIIIGTDEAGRGPAAGGVFASAVCFLSHNEDLVEKLSCLNDSKQLKKVKREKLYDVIKANSINATVCIEVDEIEKTNILKASLKAMRLACSAVLEQLKLQIQNIPDEIIKSDGSLDYSKTLTLVDGNKLISEYSFPQQSIIKGDAKSASIAAASILAKVTRDRYMEKLDSEYPQYYWAKNAGYLTKEHIEAIDKYGLTPYHRPSFLKKHFACKKQLKLF